MLEDNIDNKMITPIYPRASRPRHKAEAIQCHDQKPHLLLVSCPGVRRRPLFFVSKATKEELLAASAMKQSIQYPE